MTNFLDAEQIRAATFVRHVEIHDSLGSTNNRAAELARDPNIALPALVVARRQTAGRGRGKNVWWSADGALTFSILLDPSALGINTVNWPQVSLATAVAVCDALYEELDQRAGVRAPSRSDGRPPAGLEDEPARVNQNGLLAIKWPNDVMLDGAKVGGILIESPGGSAPTKDRLIIGIGININNSWRDAPLELAASGTALCDKTGRQHDRQSVLSNVLIALATRISEMRSSAVKLAKAWQHLNWLSGKNVAVDLNGQLCEGRCLSIDDDGTLVVATTEGARRFQSGSIRLT